MRNINPKVYNVTLSNGRALGPITASTIEQAKRKASVVYDVPMERIIVDTEGNKETALGLLLGAL